MKIKKCFFVLLISCFGFSFSSFGQLTVDVGKDTTYCSSALGFPTPMGLKVTIKSGIEPYSFAWECNVKIGSLKLLTASDILNDSTLISPTIVDMYSGESIIKFILHVTDFAGNQAKDSLNVRLMSSIFHDDYHEIELTKGDSIWLDAGDLNAYYLDYYWTSDFGLSNSKSSKVWCKPEADTKIYLTTINLFGCINSTLYYVVRIKTTMAADKLTIENKINPFQKGSKIYFNNALNQEALVSLFSLDGKLLHQCATTAQNLDLSPIILKSGQYIVKISIDDLFGVCKYLNYAK